MSRAYQILFKCPKSRHTISLQKKCQKPALSQAEAMEMFGNEEIFCTDANCRWHGKASKSEFLRIVPFTWIVSTAT